MVRRFSLVLSLLAGLLAVLLAGSAPAVGGPGAQAAEMISVNMRGTAENVSTDPLRTVFEFDLYSLETGERIGTATDDAFCSTSTVPPCPVLDAKTTLHLPDGDIVNRAKVSIAPDIQRPGWVLIGAQPGAAKTIIGGTGRYAGRTGSAELYGTDNAVGYPLRLTVDDIFVIRLDPR